MNGAQIYASRILQPYTYSRANWEVATGSKDPWKSGSQLMPGGNHTPVDEGSTTIISSATVLNIDITRLVDGWINKRFVEGDNGILLRTNGVNSSTNQPFRLKSTTPRLVIRHC